MNKTVILYKRIANNEGNLSKLPQLGRELWKMCWVTEKYLIFSKTRIEKISQKLTHHERAFSEFWRVYPKKIGKKKCEMKFMNIRISELDNIFIGLDLYMKAWKKDIVLWKKEYIPNPETWLNWERWKDEVELPEESLNLLKRDKLKAIQQEKDKVDKKNKALFEEKKEKLESKIYELEKSNSKELKLIKVNIIEKIKNTHPKVHWAMLKNLLQIHLRAEINKIYFNNK